ncbi:hypothetical protein [Lactiplantibacillus plantarum]|uniref:hypothetical protein n=1 Tax=Lactiplantibacillus plantarum TaxID=1590 RepID=UPI002238A44D|nr:hypothetical protein [Lactiplantibacillus plantarum]MCW6101953.1 hypothetical protein [Lactiplantibacillus plantarum]MCW6105036.1 hypothetical protein [Lactiplantibacillus plantarum]
MTTNVILFDREQAPVLWLQRGETVNLGADGDFELRFDEQANAYELLKSPFGKGEQTPNDQFFFFQDLFELAIKQGYAIGTSAESAEPIKEVELVPGIGQDNSKQVLRLYLK